MSPLGTRSQRRRVGRYGLELLVVFVGVWLSLVAEDWRQERTDASTERASLERMAQDLATDIVDLEFNLERARAGIDAGNALLTRATESWESPEAIHRALTAIQFCSMFIENAAEYQALRNSGRLGIIADPNLRQRIVGVYERRTFLHSQHDNDCVRTDEVLELMRPYVRLVQPPEVRATLQPSSDGFPDTANPRVSEVRDFNGLMSNVPFRNALTILVSRRRFLALQIEGTIEEAKGLTLEFAARSGEP